MLVTVDEAKLYLRLDGTEEDALIQALLETAESLCQDIVRTDFDEMEEVPEIVKVGICYAVTYLYENREKADFDDKDAEIPAVQCAEGGILMQVGRMRYRIEIQDYKSTQDADGFETREWMTVHTVWADIAPVSGKEYMASNKETAEITNKIYIRFRSGIKSTMRIKHGDRIFEIESVLGDKRSGMLTIMAREVA